MIHRSSAPDPELEKIYVQHSPRIKPSLVGEAFHTPIIPPSHYQKALDLHGYTKLEALQKVEWLLNYARQKKLQRIRIITGKGLSSPFGPVLFPAVKTALLQEKERRKITHFTAEEGVFEVFL